jgi:hypothetical protein
MPSFRKTKTPGYAREYGPREGRERSVSQAGRECLGSWRHAPVSSLVAQARHEGFTLVTADTRLHAYDVAVLDPIA